MTATLSAGTNLRFSVSLIDHGTLKVQSVTAVHAGGSIEADDAATVDVSGSTFIGEGPAIQRNPSCAPSGAASKVTVITSTFELFGQAITSCNKHLPPSTAVEAAGNFGLTAANVSTHKHLCVFEDPEAPSEYTVLKWDVFIGTLDLFCGPGFIDVTQAAGD